MVVDGRQTAGGSEAWRTVFVRTDELVAGARTNVERDPTSGATRKELESSKSPDRGFVTRHS